MNSISGIFLRFKPLSVLQCSSRVRLLYSRASIGLEDYVNARKSFESKLSFDATKFRSKMTAACNSDENSLVFTEDLKQIVHIANENEEDILLVEKMITKFHSQTSHLRFGSYVFGPVVMRLYHYLNKPNEAFKLFKNEELRGFFDQLSSHTILMDLLYNNEMYSEVLEVYKILREKQLGFGRHPKSIMVLVFAAHYKLNTFEHYKEALQLYEDMNKSGHIPLRRASCFMAALALNQKNPDISLEIIGSLPNQRFVLVRCIKALALCEIGREEDALSVLKNVLGIDSPEIVKHTFPIDVIERIQKSVEKLNSKQLTADWNRIKNQLKEQNHIVEKTLEEILCSEVTVVPPARKADDVINAAINKPTYNQKYKFRLDNRLGLKEMV